MKRKIMVSLATLLVLSTTLAATAMAMDFDGLQRSLALKNIKQMEAEIGIETKADSEVFQVKEQAGELLFKYTEESGDIYFSRSVSPNTTALKKIDTGFVVETSIMSDVSQNASELNVALPNNWSIDYAREENGEIANGSLAIFNEYGEPVASTGLATAIDAEGNSVDAALVLENGSIGVDLIGDTTAYPVNVSYGVYAANASKSVTDYFHYAGFNLVRDGSLTLGPRYFDEGSVIECTNAWNAVYALYFPNSSYWTTSTETESMENQYWCHADFAKTKNQWNLEPWRPVVSWSEMIKDRCNPE